MSAQRTLPVFTIPADEDQPTTCPSCGCRTEFSDTAPGEQEHTCLNPHCRFEFITEEEPE